MKSKMGQKWPENGYCERPYCIFLLEKMAQDSEIGIDRKDITPTC